MAERVAEDLWASAGHRVSFVRPSIIESALHRPYPGWNSCSMPRPYAMISGSATL